MKTSIVAVLVFVSAVYGNSVMAGGCCGTTPSVSKKTSSDKTQTVCPVMGGKINEKQYVDVKGKRIYVCCPGCISKIKKDPDKYIKQLEKSGVILEKTPKKDSLNQNDDSKQKGSCH